MRRFLFTVFIILVTIISKAQITFQKRYGLIYDQFGYCGQQTSDGGYVIAGESYGGAGLTDVCVFKTDSFGSLMWAKKYGGQFFDAGLSVQQTDDGGYIIAGISTSFSNDTLEDVYLIRTNAIGDTLWTKTYGGAGYQRGSSVQQTFDGGYIIGGSYLIKADSNGAVTWTKGYDGTLGFYSVQQTADSGYIVTGDGTGVGNSSDVYLMKTDAFGTPLWSKTFGGLGIDRGSSVGKTTDGGYIITGQTFNVVQGFSRVYLIRTDSIGNASWTKAFGWTGHQGASSVQETIDGGFFITGGYSHGGSLSDTTQVYLIKTDTAGDTLWTKIFGGIYRVSARFGQQTADGGYVAMGFIQDNPMAYHDVYLIKTDANGNSGCNEGSTATIVSLPSTIVSNPATTFYTPFNPVAMPASVVSNEGIETTLCSSVGINEFTTTNSFFINPNPSEGNFIISFDGTFMKGKIEILNILGEDIYSENIFNESKKEINIKNISDGLYFVKVFSGGKSYCKKLIIE